MPRRKPLAAVTLFGLGALAGALGLSLVAPLSPPPVFAATSDRYQDFAMCTGAVSMNARTQLDGVWMIDYRAGKLLGTVIDKSQGKLVGFAEVDLVSEFEVAPRQDVHFMMVTGYITQGQAALYVAETVTGKFGVYTMTGSTSGQGVTIRRHDLTSFRKALDPANAAAGAAAPAPGLPAMPVGAPPAAASVPPLPAGLVPPPK